MSMAASGARAVASHLTCGETQGWVLTQRRRPITFTPMYEDHEPRHEGQPLAVFTPRRLVLRDDEMPRTRASCVAARRPLPSLHPQEALSCSPTVGSLVARLGVSGR